MEWITEFTQHKEYINNNIEYTVDGELLDFEGKPVMMKWEAPIMKDAAKLICRNGGRVLNVGFGLGLIDTYIQSHNIDEHWIIEAHPGVISKMKEDGWDKKPNVVCKFDMWQNIYKDLPKFDGIYFDTWMESTEDFHSIIHELLNPNGVYTYFHTSNEYAGNFINKGYKVEEHWTELNNISENQGYFDKTKTKHKHNLIINNK